MNLSEQHIPTVSDLTEAIKTLLEESIGFVTVKGEISNYKEHSSGHKYFILKDENSQVSCTMWRQRKINFTPKDGMKIIVSGNLTVYPPRGQYQIECTAIQPLGLGDLYLAYEALKQKLDEAGYFAAENKKTIPEIALNIGVVTSPTGAAIKDILSTIERRFPLARIYFRPALVQGEGSAEDIARAINQFQKYPVDVLIVGRGGGSIEDLWSFNTEIVADAIFKSKIPIISAVGHETDFTIADFVADLRAATPTAAAEIVTPFTKTNILAFLSSSQIQLIKSINSEIDSYSDIIKSLTSPYIMRRISDKIKIFVQQLDEYEIRALHSINSRISSFKQKTLLLENHCRSVNPSLPFKKGFALIKSEGKIIPYNTTLGNYINVDIVRSNETATATINKIIPNKGKNNESER